MTLKPGAFIRHVFRESLLLGLIWKRWHERMGERIPDGTRVDRQHLLGFLLALQ